MRSLTAGMTAALVLLPAAPAWAANGAPVVVDDAVNVRNMAMSQWVHPLDNDSDPDGDPLTYTAVTNGTKGTASVDSRYPTYLNYQPFPGVTAGTDSFTYTVSDGNGNTATGTVTVTLWDNPAVPSGLTISSAGPDAVTLTWAPAAGATQYRIHRDGGDVTTTGLTWTDTGLQDLNSYVWTVGAVNAGGFESSWSDGVYREYRQATPTSLTVQSASATSLSLDWDGTGAGPWNVYRDGVLVASPAVSEFVDSGLATGREYGYQVQHAYPSTTTVVNPPSALSAVVRGVPDLTPIDRLFQELGGTGGVLGPVTTAESAIAGGRQQIHQNGLILQQDGEAPLAVLRPLSTAYTGAGGATGDLGFPVDEQATGLRASGVGQLFENGSIWYSPFVAPSAVVVPQVIEDGWAASGWEEGPLGYPAIRPQATADGVRQIFEGGGVWWSAATGSHAVMRISGFFDVWGLGGYEAGRLGYPITDEECGLRDDGCVQEYEGGSIASSPDNGVHAVFAPYEDVWAHNGWEDGRLGYPTTNEYCGLRGSGCVQLFQGGSIYRSPATGAHFTLGAIRNTYAGQGWENGRLGYPTTDEYCGYRDGGCLQLFQGGSIYWSPATGAHFALGAIRDTWGGERWEKGRLGYPTTDEICGLRGGGCVQLFQGGSIYWSPATGARIVLGEIRNAYAGQGWENGRLGYPTSGEILTRFPDGNWIQYFQGGSIQYNPTTRRTSIAFKR